MRYSIKTVLTLSITVLVMGMSSALGFSFDFGDDDDDYWRYMTRGDYNRPWVAPNGVYFYPRLPYFQRSDMVDRRQGQMRQRHHAMQALGEMLYGRAGFDRADAIKLARKIEATSAQYLTRDFHPGAIATDRSRTLLSLWGNQPAFHANARALQVAANELAEAFEKGPAAEKGAVMLAQKMDRFGNGGNEKVVVSADVWDKFNALSAACDSCHRDFRGVRW